VEERRLATAEVVEPVERVLERPEIVPWYSGLLQSMPSAA
jgi:hypothetical protein